ncbi:hypothetical protein [Bacteroides stercorirosoris]|uniref:Lipoprotein n=1 Tax=Bacteroides stercorirosoris TaxID=871324 RepID=A0A1M6BVY3_9BACE|nr:hypothetical protein [Bacteroides stercorirosoris]SHI52684.1 hypothetical protein SAMN05444350_103175 [Bacteroides stercorirosoris]
MNTNPLHSLASVTASVTTSLTACLLALACLTACDRKELFEHQELYAATVSIRPDWQSQSPTASALQIRIRGTHPATDFSPAISTDTTFTLAASGAAAASAEAAANATATAAASAANAALPEALLTLPEASYSLIAWHEASGLTFDGTRFRLSTLPDGTLAEPAPLCAAAITFCAIAGQENRPPLKMQPHTRLLKLTLNISQGTPELLTDVTATLTGCAATREIRGGEKLTRGEDCELMKAEACELTKAEGDKLTRTAETGDVGSIRPVFTRNGNTLSATHRLLGIAPAVRQQLTLTLHYAEGELQTQVYDLTSFLSGFNRFSPDTADEVFTLTGDLQLQQSLESPGISGTITGWTPGTETDLEAGNK